MLRLDLLFSDREFALDFPRSLFLRLLTKAILLVYLLNRHIIGQVILFMSKRIEAVDVSTFVPFTMVRVTFKDARL